MPYCDPLFEKLLKGLTRTTARNMAGLETFFLNWDFTEIGMQTPIIHMNLERRKERNNQSSSLTIQLKILADGGTAYSRILNER
jgi:hypothetical protein